jgi:hypothetical protein
MLSIFQFAAFPGTLLTGLVAGGAIAARARRRGGRIPLPESVANLTPNDEPALSSVDAFVDRLAELTLDQWLDVGHRLVTNQETLALRSTSWAIMDATIADRRLGLAAWHARDAVETMAYVASAAAPRLSRRDRRLFAAAHAAAEDATLAVLVRGHLSPQDFAVLCAPFDSTATFGFSSRR